MIALITAVLALLLGAAGCLLPIRNVYRAAFGLISQAIATGLVLSAVLPVLFSGQVLTGDLPWAFPVGPLKVRLDALGAFFLVWSLPMTLLGSIYAVGYLRKHFDTPRHVGLHFALLNMTALSFIVVYTGDHALVFLLGWEIAALAAWLLVIWDYSSQKIRFAGFNYLVSTHVGLIFLVAAFMILYTHSHSWELVSFGQWLKSNSGSERNMVFMLLVASFGLKSAFFPFHSWLPRAHAAAPAHVSALMSGVIHKAGLYALVRFLWLMGKPDEWMGWFLIIFSACSALIGALYTVGQRDLKRLLGYSSTENVGIAGIGFGVGSLGLTWDQPVLVALGFAGGLLHVLNHAFFKCQLFYAAGAVYQSSHTVNIEKLGGLARLMPWTALSFLVGGIAISALPPLNGFSSEFLIYKSLFAQTAVPLVAKLALCLAAAALAFVGAVSALSITRAFGVVFLGSPREASGHPPQEVSRWMLFPMAVHATGVIVLGVAPFLGLALILGPIRIALGLSGPVNDAALELLQESVRNSGWVSGILAALVALVLGLRALLRKRAAPAQVTWGCGYELPNPRMQYTGAGFSEDFSKRFDGVMSLMHRREARMGYFPTDAWLKTECIDAVEQRMYSVIGQGNQSAREMSDKMREDDPRFAFAIALISLMAIAGLVALSSGPLR